MIGYVVVIASLGLTLWLVHRRLNLRTTPSPGGRLRVVDRVGLGPRQGVALVEVDGTCIVVGFGEGGVRSLGRTDGDWEET